MVELSCCNGNMPRTVFDRKCEAIFAWQSGAQLDPRRSQRSRIGLGKLCEYDVGWFASQTGISTGFDI